MVGLIVGDVVNIFGEGIEFDYIKNESGEVIGVGHESWGFTIMRNQSNKMQTAFVDNETNEPFGILESKNFNSVLLAWLLIDQPELIGDK